MPGTKYYSFAKANFYSTNIINYCSNIKSDTDNIISTTNLAIFTTKNNLISLFRVMFLSGKLPPFYQSYAQNTHVVHAF